MKNYMRVMVFGTGSYYFMLKKRLNEFSKYIDLDIIAFIDNDSNKVGNSFENKRIIAVNQIKNYQFDYIIIASSFYFEIKNQLILLELGEKIFPLSDIISYIEYLKLGFEGRTFEQYMHNRETISYDDYDNNLYSRFITYEDSYSNNFVFEMPVEWWSRIYEYYWVKTFVKPNETCLDAACGVAHPLKFYLSSKRCKVFACDIDERILDKGKILNECINTYGEEQVRNLPIREFGNIKFDRLSLDKLSYQDEFFDKIFCISVLEHLPIDILKGTIEEFSRVIKKNGILILTFDYPYVGLIQLIEILENNNFYFYDKFNLKIPSNAISSDCCGEKIYCYRGIFIKK